MTTPPPVIVIGGGIAGVTCAQTLANNNPALPVLLISASPVVKVVHNLKTIGRSIDVFDVIERNSQALATENLRVKIGKVVGIDFEKKKVFLDDGEELGYLKICICTGARPKVIPVEDKISHQYIKCIRDTQTVKDFQSILRHSKRIVIVGNGGIASELVHEIQDCEIIWAIRDKSFGATFFDAAAAKFFEDFLDQDNAKGEESQTVTQCGGDATQSKSLEFGAALGPQWHCGFSMKGRATKKVIIENCCEVKRVFTIDNPAANEQEKFNIHVELTNGKIYGCCMLISATGVVPNADIFAHLERADDNGIVIDNEMRTNAEDVYAAGDVATVGWTLSPNWFQMRLWTQARQMGYYAAKCIEAHLTNNASPALYFNFDIFTHVTKFFGFRVILLGLYNGQKMPTNDYKILLKVDRGKTFIKAIVAEGKLRGAILIGDTDLEETFENLIYNEIDISNFGDHLLDNILDLEDYFD